MHVIYWTSNRLILAKLNIRIQIAFINLSTASAHCETVDGVCVPLKLVCDAQKTPRCIACCCHAHDMELLHQEPHLIACVGVLTVSEKLNVNLSQHEWHNAGNELFKIPKD